MSHSKSEIEIKKLKGNQIDLCFFLFSSFLSKLYTFIFHLLIECSVDDFPCHINMIGRHFDGIASIISSKIIQNILLGKMIKRKILLKLLA